MDKIEETFKMIKCPKCGKYTTQDLVLRYGTCLCGQVLDPKAKYKYEMFCRLKLWRGKNYSLQEIERGKYD